MTRGCWITLSLLVLVSACDEEPTEPAASREAESASQSASAPQKRAAADQKGLRCGDFLSAEEAQAIGLDDFDPDAVQPKAGLGVSCGGSLGVGVQIFRGQELSSMKGGAEEAGIKMLDGPTIGQSSYWYESGGMAGVAFITSNGNYTGGVTGRDKAVVEEVARKVEPYLNKP